MGYIGQAPGLGIKRDFLFIATAGQTSFSGVDANGMTLSFDPRTVIVFVNGSRVIKTTDYSAPNSSTITFTTGLDLLDEVAIESFEAFSPANTYSKDEADTLLAKKLSVDLPQTFTDLEQGQARGNIGVDLIGGLRNKIINGSFEVSQRGTVWASHATGTFGPDRWLTIFNGSGTHNMTRTVLTTGLAGVAGSKYGINWYQSSAGSGSTDNRLETRIEGVETLAGKKATLTFYAWVSSPTSAATITTNGRQQFGTGGSPSSAVAFGGSTNLNLTTTPQRFDVVMDVPSISGKTIGTDINDYLAIVFNMPLNAITSVNITRVSLVEGDATKEDDPFSARHIQQELALCQRYYEKTYNTTVAPATITYVGAPRFRSNTASDLITHLFRVEKRAVPTITLYSPVTGLTNKWHDVGAGADVNVALTSASTTCVITNVAGVDGNQTAGHWTADAEL